MTDTTELIDERDELQTEVARLRAALRMTDTTTTMDPERLARLRRLLDEEHIQTNVKWLTELLADRDRLDAVSLATADKLIEAELERDAIIEQADLAGEEGEHTREIMRGNWERCVLATGPAMARVFDWVMSNTTHDRVSGMALAAKAEVDRLIDLRAQAEKAVAQGTARMVEVLEQRDAFHLERDEARRAQIRAMFGSSSITMARGLDGTSVRATTHEQVAELWGWDCYPEPPKPDAARRELMASQQGVFQRLARAPGCMGTGELDGIRAYAGEWVKRAIELAACEVDDFGDSTGVDPDDAEHDS